MLGVDGTRSVGLRPGNRFRVSVFVFPSTFSPTFQLFAPFRTRWALTGHVPSDFVPVNRFRVTVHVFAQFSAVCTVPDALGVYGTRSTFSPRLTDFAFPSTFSPSFTCFHSSGRAGRWRDTFRRTSSRLTVFVFPSTFSPSFTCFHSSGRGWDTFRPTSSRLTVFAYPSMFSPSFQLCAPCPDALAGDGTRSTFSPRLTVFAFPSTFSPSFTGFPSSKVLDVDRTRSVELRHGSTFSHLLTDNQFLTLPSTV